MSLTRYSIDTYLDLHVKYVEGRINCKVACRKVQYLMRHCDTKRYNLSRDDCTKSYDLLLW